MKRRLAALLSISILVFAPALMAGSKADHKYSLSFHLETDSNDNPKMIFTQEDNGKTRYFRRMPEVTSKDVVSFSPFPSEANDGYGVVFRLKDNAARRLVAVTSINQGRWLIAQINGRMVDAVVIDKPISDGLLVVWKGVTLDDVKIFDAALPRIGKEGKNGKNK